MVSNTKRNTEVELIWKRTGDITLTFSNELINRINIKRDGVPQEQMGGEARSLLTSAVMECISSTVFYLLNYHNVPFTQIKAVADSNLKQGEDRRQYVDYIDITI